MINIGTLRPVKDNELEIMRNWRNEPAIRANMYTQHEISSEEHKAWWSRVSQDKTQRYFMYDFSGMPSGIVGFTNINSKNKQAFWAFYAAPKAPRGTGSRMEVLALDHAFDELELHKLSCEVLAYNTAVINLHQKFGFKVEGVFRDQYYLEDKYVDVYRLGILSSEWDSKRPEIIEKLKKFNQK